MNTSECLEILNRIVEDMERRGVGGERLARYLNQIVFCLFAEDAGLLDDTLFSDAALNHRYNPEAFNSAIKPLFNQIGAGDLFNELDMVELSTVSMQWLVKAVSKDWRDIEPSIFGTLFEGVMDATKRSRLGAYYTSAEDIMLVVDPVVAKPLKREWDDARQEANALISQDNKDAALARLEAFQHRIAGVRVLDPACGSGNFLCVAMRSLLDLEKEVLDFAGEQGWHHLAPSVNPRQMLGIDTDRYAIELACVALWIGYIQWHQTNGFPYTQQPILTSLIGVRQMDAILDYDAHGNPIEPQWSNAEFIVGNPPFLGHSTFRRNLGNRYADALYSLYGNRIPNSSDLCCYWFEKARAHIKAGKSNRAGLLATQAIRFQSNRAVLTRIKASGDIFMAYSDREWVLNGAAVNVSVIGFDDGGENDRALDGVRASNINADLTRGLDLTRAKRLPENIGISYMGVIKVGPFEITREVAEDMISQSNAHGKPNSDVVKRWMIGRDINQTNRDMWIIDFGANMSKADAALYEAPFEYVVANVKPTRYANTDARCRDYWWIHGRPHIKLQKALADLNRYIGTSLTSQHRIFKYIDGDVLPDATIVVFTRDDDYFFGVLQSRIHTVWALAKGSQLRTTPRYTLTDCFDTFPFPRPTDEQREAIAEAARELNRLRDNWKSHDVKRTLTNLYNDNPVWLINAHATLDAAVADAYGWRHELSDEQILDRLLTLNLELTDGGWPLLL